MIKMLELKDPESCFNKADDDEPLFVLLGRDVAAVETLLAWCDFRIKAGKNKPHDAQIEGAFDIARRMKEYRMNRLKERGE